MTFFELIRASLLADSTENRPPSKLAKVVLHILQAKTAQGCHGEVKAAGQYTTEDPNPVYRNN